MSGRGDRSGSLWSLSIFLTLFLWYGTTWAGAGTWGHEFLPPEHWTYSALYRFEALGFVTLPGGKPLTRDDVIRYVEIIRKGVDEGQVDLAPRDHFELSRLEQEFLGEAQANPRRRFDPPVLYAEDEYLRLEGDLDLSFVPEKRLLEPTWDFFGILRPDLRLHIGRWVTYEVRYRLTYGPERGDRARDEKPSPREKSFKGLTSLFERSYMIFHHKKLLLWFGRDYSDYGPAENGNVHLSESAGSLDQAGGRIDFLNLRLHFFHSKLSGESKRYFSAHRLEIMFHKVVFGISETVLYLDRGFDPVYLLPLSSFYANQFNERRDDNLLWSIDAKYQPVGGVMVYGALLIDDFQFERDENHPDKLAFDLGARVASGGRLPVTLRLRYRYADIYTYTHRDSLKFHIAGAGDFEMGDPPLGAHEGPDADHFSASVAFYPWPAVTSALLFNQLRRGEGNDYTKFEDGLDPTPPFPSGIVETTVSFGLSVDWELPGNSSVGAVVRENRVENIGHIPGRNEWDTFVKIHFTWDL